MHFFVGNHHPALAPLINEPLVPMVCILFIIGFPALNVLFNPKDVLIYREMKQNVFQQIQPDISSTKKFDHFR